MTALRAGWLFDGTSPNSVRDGVVIVENGIVKSAGPSSSVDIPDLAQTIDLPTSTILPGLIDMHGHLAGQPENESLMNWLSEPSTGLFTRPSRNGRRYTITEARDALIAVNGLQRDLRTGVTTMRNVSENSMVGFSVREALRLGAIGGPSLLVGGIGIKAMNASGVNCRGFDNPEAIRDAVRMNLEAGAEVIKVFVTGGMNDGTALSVYLGRDVLRTIISDAHAIGARVAAHAHGGEGLTMALQEGCDSIEHGALITVEDLPLFLDSGACLVSTWCEMWRLKGLGRVKEAFADVVCSAVQSGVRVCLGSDGGHGQLPTEMRILTSFGMSTSDVLLAATRVAAESCGLGDEIGTLEPGKQADLIAVSGDPIRNIAVMENIDLVMKGGVLVHE